MNAQYTFCMVPGKTKAKAVDNTLNGKISEIYPSTILRKHPNTSLFLDESIVLHTDLLDPSGKLALTITSNSMVASGQKKQVIQEIPVKMPSLFQGMVAERLSERLIS